MLWGVEFFGPRLFGIVYALKQKNAALYITLGQKHRRKLKAPVPLMQLNKSEEKGARSTGGFGAIGQNFDAFGDRNF